MKKAKITTGLLLSIFIGITVNAQVLQSIQGTINNKQSQPIFNATVYLLNTNYAAITNTTGNFVIANVHAGSYTMVASAPGYATINQNISVGDIKANTINITLEDAINQLDDVIVTAEKKEEMVQRIPAAVSVLTSKAIDDYRLWNTKDLTAIIPSLYAGNPGDGRNITSVRGITSTSYDPAVTTYIDGVNQFTLDTYIPQIFDAERIEVLRGPQGTLYGRNAMGGVINILTKQPTNNTNGFVEASIGNYGRQRYIGAVRTPFIKDKLYFGASLLYDGMNGYYYNDFNNSKFDKQHSFGGNYYLKYLPSSTWAITLNAKHVANRNDGSFPLAGSVDEAFSNPYHLNQNAVATLVDNVFNASLSANYSGRGFNFSTQTSYQSNYRYYAQPIDGDFSPVDAITIINDYGKKWNNVKVLTEELRFTSPASASKFKWTTGAYFFYQNTPNKQATHFGKDAILVGSPDSNYAIINTTKAKSFGAAVYAQGNYAITNKLNFIAGLRYDYQHSKQEVLGEYQPDGSPAPVFETQPDTSGKVSYSAVSPMASLAYKASVNTNIYLTYSRGYRTGGLTQLGSDPSQPPLYAYKPEYSNNFEIGFKNTLLNNRLRANIALFYTNITNAQVPTLILPDAITVTKNAGKLESKGIEAELATTPVKGLQLIYNFGYTDAKYTALKLSKNGEEVDLSGNKQIFTPDVTSLLAAQYNIAIVPSKKLSLILRGEWSYLGKTYFDLSNTIKQDAYSLFNIKTGVTLNHLELYFWMRNMGDKKYVSYAYDFGAVHLGDPKTYGFTLKVSF